MSSTRSLGSAPTLEGYGRELPHGPSHAAAAARRRGDARSRGRVPGVLGRIERAGPARRRTAVGRARRFDGTGDRRVLTGPRLRRPAAPAFAGRAAPAL